MRAQKLAAQKLLASGGNNATIRTTRFNCGYVFCWIIFLRERRTSSNRTYQLTLNQMSPDTETVAGTFSIDSSFLAPNTQINFVNFLSFSMPVEGVLWTLSDALNPTTEGVVTDGTGAVFQFNDSASTIFTEFCRSGCGQFLRFQDSSFSYDTLGGDSGGVTLGTYSISVISTVPVVPLPPALLLFATGLGALGLLTWRRKRKAVAA